mgnify:FL=1|jgi:hypothetical protein
MLLSGDNLENVTHFLDAAWCYPIYRIITVIYCFKIQIIIDIYF